MYLTIFHFKKNIKSFFVTVKDTPINVERKWQKRKQRYCCVIFARQCRQLYPPQRVQIVVPIVDSEDSYTYCRQCRQLYPLQTVWTVVPTIDSVDSYTYCTRCKQLHLLQTVQIVIPIVPIPTVLTVVVLIVDGVDSCTYCR